jgi:hypothetical protein
MEEYIPATFHLLLMLSLPLLFLLGVPLTLFLAYGSWLLAFVCTFILFPFLWLLARHPRRQHVIIYASTQTWLTSPTPTLVSMAHASGWLSVGGQVVGTMGALRVEDLLLRKKQL